MNFDACGGARGKHLKILQVANLQIGAASGVSSRVNVGSGSHGLIRKKGSGHVRPDPFLKICESHEPLLLREGR